MKFVFILICTFNLFLLLLLIFRNWYFSFCIAAVCFNSDLLYLLHLTVSPFSLFKTKRFNALRCLCGQKEQRTWGFTFLRTTAGDSWISSHSVNEHFRQLLLSVSTRVRLYWGYWLGSSLKSQFSDSYMSLVTVSPVLCVCFSNAIVRCFYIF